MIKIQLAVTHSLRQQIKGLLQANNLPTSDITNNTLLFAALMQGKLVASAGADVFSNFALLRSVSVDDAYKGTGIGKQIAVYTEQYIKQINLQHIYLITTTAEHFFAKRGYMVVERHWVPDELKQQPQFASVCPDSATVMHKTV